MQCNVYAIVVSHKKAGEIARNDRLGMDLFHYFIRLDTYGRATEEQLSSKGNTLRWNEFAVSGYVKQIH